MTSPRDKMLQLVDRQIEDRLSASDQQRLSELLSSNPELIADYTRYICLHGQLFWDAGLAVAPLIPTDGADTPQQSPKLVSRSEDRVATASQRVRGRSSSRTMAVAATVLVVLTGLFVISRPSQQGPTVVVTEPNRATSATPDPHETAIATINNAPEVELGPLELHNPALHKSTRRPKEVAVADMPAPVEYLPADFDNDVVVAKVDELLQTSWDEQGIDPSPPAHDSEWVRRVYLTMLGRVPTLQETDQFLADTSPRKRMNLVHSVSTNSERASHFAVIWTNLLIGRTKKPGVNRESLFDFLVKQFKSNSPWIDTVDQLITARGRNDQNGATNFLLAHLNNQATPATAVTARLFLGEQISCVQCHDHPFSKEVRQQDYWALNAFFKDTQKRTVALANSSADSNMEDTPWQLVDRPGEDRMTYYLTRSGLTKAVLPGYDGKTLDRRDDINRRQELAKLLAADSDAKVARAMVNRMWDQFFGYGFTNAIDDMGPHAEVSHPELLDLLTEAFVKSGYDLQRLTQWIAGTRAWQSSSQSAVANAVDDPESGTMPLFSRVYVRRMTPEQVYESIRVAIRSAAGQSVDAGKVHSGHRRDWVRQFAQAYDTDENDESLDFEGTIAQAMVMMNGVEVDQAIHQATEAIVRGNGTAVSSPTEALNRVSLAMLTREPTSQEETVFRRHYRRLSQQKSGTAMVAAIEDMMWAYLNSSEFVLVH